MGKPCLVLCCDHLQQAEDSVSQGAQWGRELAVRVFGFASLWTGSKITLIRRTLLLRNAGTASKIRKQYYTGLILLRGRGKQKG